MRRLLRFPKLIARCHFQGRSTIPPPTHRFPHFLSAPKLCPYWNCDINQIGKISVERMNQKVDAGMKMLDLKLLDFSQRLDEIKSAEKSTGNWYTIVAFLSSLLGLTEWVKKNLAIFEDLRKEVYIFINETVKRLKELDGKILEIIMTLKDFQARVEKLEKELKNSTLGGRNDKIRSFAELNYEDRRKENKRTIGEGSSM